MEQSSGLSEISAPTPPRAAGLVSGMVADGQRSKGVFWPWITWINHLYSHFWKSFPDDQKFHLP